MTSEEILKFTYWWYQDLDQAQRKHEVGLAESTGVDWGSFCREVFEITLLSYWKTVTNSAEKEKSYRSTKVNLARGNTTEVITSKASGSLGESRKTAGNVSWRQWKNGTNKHYRLSSKNGLNLDQQGQHQRARCKRHIS